MSKREVVDRRWTGVELPSLWRVLVRVHGEDHAAAHLEEARREVLETGRYGEWLAVRMTSKTILPERCQITGFRRANPKEWFYFGKDSGEIQGPFSTKKLTLHALRAKSAKTVESGVYETPTHYVFTRDRAERVNLRQEELL